ncbi:MAG: type 4a pilus biogenesis protein PilO [Anaerolineaceae bacterium]|nr:type 4a pilus biogenesis protein PilO [Anaerolineaceae bacterium]
MRFLPIKALARQKPSRYSIRIYITAGCLVVVLLAFFFLFIRPKRSALAARREEIQDRQTSLQLLEVETARLKGARIQLEQLERAVEAFESGLPSQEEIGVILREVWVIADAAGLKTQRIKTLDQRQQGAYKVLPIEMKLNGSFKGVCRFLLSLERLPGVSIVQSLQLQTTPDLESDEIEAALVLNVYCKD